MRNNSNDAVNLLVIDPSPNDAESYAGALRNAGIAVHVRRVDNADALAETLDGGSADLALYNADTPGLDPGDGLKLFNKAKSPVPLLMLAKSPDETTVVRFLRAGARDVLRKGHTPHLQLAVKRELETLALRRRVSDLERRITETEGRNTSLMESSRQAIAYVHEGMHVRANPAYLQLFGYADMLDLEGIPLLDMVIPDDHSALKKALRGIEVSADQETPNLELTCENTSGTQFPAMLEFSAASIDGEPCTQVIISERQNKKELEQKLLQLSTQDPQTGLRNRQYFTDLLEDLRPQLDSGKQDRALLYLSIDGFTDLRKTLGLAASDTLLREIAEVLAGSAGTDAELTRFGDHSFTMLSNETDRPAIEALAEKLRRAVEGHSYSNLQQFVAPTCSIGITLASELGEVQPQEWINRAYQACELAGRNGGNRYQFYEQLLAATAATTGGSEVNLSDLIGYAVKNERFRLVYQPIVSLQGDIRENYAVLVRLLDQNNEQILPTHFLQHAERSGQLPAIDRWVLRHAIAELAEQRRAGKKLFFFVSISGASLEQADLVLYLCNLIEEYQVRGAWLTLQLSERDVRARIQPARKFVEEIKKIGCQFAIDQFGLLPKPESFLRHFALDFVRYDRSFMDNLTKNPKKQDELHALNELVTSFQIKTVATAVEDANSLAILWNVGVSYIQGYFLQEPSETIAYDFSHG